jgi:hypothetical protein
MRDVDVRGGSTSPKWIEKPWPNSSEVAGRDPVADLLSHTSPVQLVGHEHHHDVGAGGGLAADRHVQARPPSPCRRTTKSGRRPTTTSTPDSLS